MLNPNRYRHLFALLATLSLVFFAACSDDGSTDPTPVPTDPEAYAALEDAVFDMMNGADPQSPGDIDFTEAYDMYSRIVADDPTNLDAQLGVSVAAVMAVMANSQLNDTFDAWEAYLEDFTPFEAAPPTGFMRPLGIAISPTTGAGSFDLPFEMISTTVLAGMHPELKAVDPTIGAVQDVIADVIIPALDAAATHLAIVAADPDFTFIISPRLQGDLEADPLEFDATDAYALRAGILLVTAACRAGVTYDLSFATHDVAGLTAALDRDTGNFLSLRDDGAAQMAQAEADFLAAVDAVDDGIDALLAEDDDQDDDVIVTGPDTFSENELRDLQDNELVDAREVFTVGVEIEGDWDNDWYTPDTVLEIAPHDFFQNPIADWKQLLPPYTVSTTIGEDYANYNYEHYIYNFDVTMGAAGHAYAYFYLQLFDGEIQYAYASGSQEIEAAFEDMVPDLLAYLLEQTDYAGGRAWLDGSVSTELNAGLNTDVPVEMWFGYDAYEYYHIPVITWDADTYEEWQAAWTNYDLNGLLPGMTSTADLMDLFNMNADNWSKEFTIEWYDVDLDVDFD